MKRVILTGGTGYVGCHLTDALARRSVDMVVLARKSAPQEAKEFVRSRGAVVREVDYASGGNLSAEFRGCDVWFHLIGSIQRSRHDSFDHRHRELTASLVAQARRCGVGKVVFLTALGTSVHASNAYHRTKGEAECEVVQSGLPYALIRPSLICGRVVGPRNSKLVMRYVRMIRERGRVVVLGNGRNLIQPIDIRDLAECMIRAAEQKVNDVAIYELGGSEHVEFQEFVHRLAKALGKTVAIRHFPLWLAGTVARLLEVFQETPVLTREQVALVRENNICALDSVERQFGFRPRSLDSSLATYGEDGR